MSNAVILAAGPGSKIWPYGEIRPKALIPVANRPVVSYLVDDLIARGVTNVYVAVSPPFGGDLRHEFRDEPQVRVIETDRTNGTADTLLAVWERIGTDEDISVFFGDILVEAQDLSSFFESHHPPAAVAALLAPFSRDECRDWIGATLADGQVQRILGHSRGKTTHRFAGFRLSASFHPYLESCPAYFPSVEVGMMPPREKHIEAAVEMWRRDSRTVTATVCAQREWDLDKPWHILEANRSVLDSLCGRLTETELADGATIDPSASVVGPVSLGKGSRIGKNVIIRGRLIAGEQVDIDAGAIINGDVIIGARSFVGNACFVEHGSVIGADCVVSHAAELAGVIFDGVYLYHYMEIHGIVGQNSDIGAATVCGTLRFDDGATIHRVKGRREIPPHYANASYLGDYCRTGVNATIMPGRKTGPYSLVGPNVLLEEDLPGRTGVRVQQEQHRFPWGPDQYGW